MDKLEHYLDQVCRSIGGSKALRDHVRQELREHLLDAIAGHKAAGLADDAALARALEEFGKPEEVCSELEATYGQRKMMSLVIDKALDWKEKTMKATWLWMSWAYLAVATVIALELMFISFNVIFILPKVEKLQHDGMIDAQVYAQPETHWVPEFLDGVKNVAGRYATYWLIGIAAAWGLFEWRVRSDNKSFMRLSALGSMAVALMIVVLLLGTSLVVIFCLAMPAMGQLARPYALQQIETIETTLPALEQAQAKKDWDGLELQATRLSSALAISPGPVPPSPPCCPRTNRSAGPSCAKT